jgi:putative transposase
MFEDESGFCLVSPLKRTWSRRGQTPVIRTALSHHERFNVVGAICVTPKGRRLRLCVQCHTRSLNGELIVRFLQHVLRQVAGPIVLVWDNHPIHRRALVRDFLARHPRLHVFWFPRYAPELNPAEGIWNQTAEYTANSAPHNGDELSCNVRAGLARTRRSQQRLLACLLASDLPTKRNIVHIART